MRINKIAFLDCLEVGGGLSRFTLSLSRSLVEFNEDLEIEYFILKKNLFKIPELKDYTKNIK